MTEIKIDRFMSRDQISAIKGRLIGEEPTFFSNKLREVMATLYEMPKTYETDEQGQDAKAVLHYFNSGPDWYITERDQEEEQIQAFGYAVLNGDTQNAETGYINIQELIGHGVELDLYWTPKTIRQIKAGK